MNLSTKYLHLFNCSKKYITPYLFISRQYKTISASDSISTSVNKDRVEARHFAPGSSEWINNSYFYNKSMANLPFSHKYSKSILRQYFNLYVRSKNRKRLPIYYLLKLFMKNHFSLPMIKESNNKSIVTLYIYNREKRYIINEIFLLKQLLNRQLEKKQNLSLETEQQLTLFNNLSKQYSEIKKRKNSLSLQKDYNRYLLEAFMRDAKKITLFFLKKRLVYKSILLHLFLKWVLSIIGIKVTIYKKFYKNIRGKRYNCIHEIEIKKGKHINSYVLKNNSPTYINKKSLSFVNVILIKYLKMYYLNNNSKKQLYKIKLLLSVFKHRHIRDIVNTYPENNTLILKYLSLLRLQINKFNGYIPVLKTLLKKIVNKKVVINLVDLNYFYMNSDMYSELSSKILEKDPKVKSLIKLNRVIKIQNLENNNFTVDYRNIYTRNLNFNFPEKNNKDFLYIMVQNMFRKNSYNDSNKLDKFKYTSNKYWQTNINNILNFLNHKWVTGVRVEAKGRLTTRRGASRSSYIEAYKGNLRIMHYITDPDLKEQSTVRKSPSVALVRNNSTTNLQYSYIGSKTIPGAFGVKTWISSN